MRKPKPALINLENYAATLLRQKDSGVTLRPPPTIPGLIAREWSCEEMEMMRNNRRLARATYKFIKESDL